MALPPGIAKTLKGDLSYRGWVLFPLLLLSNSLLSHGNLSLTGKLFVATFGLILPLGVAFLLIRKGPSPSSPRPLADPPPWAWALLLVLLLFTRFYHLESLPGWFLADEGRHAIFSLDLSEKWEGRLLWGETQGLPLAFWVFGALFKFVTPSVLALRLIPALLSLLVLAAAYRVARPFLPAPFLFAFVWLAGLGFWPFCVSRLFMGWVLFLLIEFLVLLFLSSCLSSPGKLRNLLFLAAALAAGYYLALIGKVLVASAVLTLAFLTFVQGKMRKGPFFLFLGVLGALISPMVLRELAPGGTHYLLTQSGRSLNFSYLSALFWDGSQSAPYGPAWGGIFNPIVTSLFLAGIVQLFREKKVPLVSWILLSFGLFMLPGILSTGLEVFRVLAVFPLVVFTAVFGLQGLALEAPRALRWPFLLLLLTVSSALDLYHYAGPYQELPQVRRIWRNDNLRKVHALLRAEKEKGTRLGLLDFTIHDHDDRTLESLVRPFNGALDPRTDLRELGEIAVLTDPNYEPFLKERFPGASWTWIVEVPGEDGLLLGLIPTAGKNGEVLNSWREAGGFLRQVKSLHMYWQSGHSRQPLFDLLFAHPSAFEGDAFLRSVFWEEAALLFNMERDLPEALASTQKAAQKGYPAAHLFNEWGALLAAKGDLPAARAAFEKACRAPVDRTGARENLELLRRRAP